MANYDSIDMRWTWDGDYVISPSGDIDDTSSDLLESLRTEIHTVLKSEFDDWQFDPSVAANLSDFRGQPNSRETARDLEQRIKGRLVASRIVKIEDIGIRIIPTSKHEVLSIITINATSTPLNGLSPGEPLVVSLVYDSIEDSIFFVDESEESRQARSY